MKNKILHIHHGYKRKFEGQHPAVDISNRVRNDVLASQSGRVIRIRPGSKHGENQVVIQNTDGTTSTYSHTAPSVEVGKSVFAGDVLGKTDLSGRSSGGNVHYRIDAPKAGGPIDPLTRLPKR